VDTEGCPLRVIVHFTGIQGRDGAALLLATLEACQTLTTQRDEIAAQRDALAARNEQLHHLLLKLKRQQFGQKPDGAGDPLLYSTLLFLGMAAYLGVTMAYSFGLKRVPLLDALIIALLFGMRILVGVAALEQPVSSYLMTFALFFFFSLAMAKRHTEILRAGPNGAPSLAARGYRPADAELTLVVGVASALGSLIVLVLYLIQDAFLRVPYADPEWLWAMPLLIAVWLGRIWLLSHRSEMLDDPVSFAIRDRTSCGLGVAVGIAYLLAL
jgi:4-hydroxybenzoate polyprenyltransferase